MQVGVVGSCVTLVLQSVKSLWNAFQYAWSRFRGDEQQANEYLAKAESHFQIDELLRVFGDAALSYIVLGLGFGAPIATIAVAILLPLADRLFRTLSAKVEVAGGWFVWVSSWIIDDRFNYAWDSAELEAAIWRREVPEQLICGITHDLM